MLVPMDTLKDTKVARVVRRVKDAISSKKAADAKKSSAAKKTNTPTHVVSVFMGTVSQLVNVPKGALLRFTMKILGDKSKLDFAYMPGGAYDGGAMPCLARACTCVLAVACSALYLCLRFVCVMLHEFTLLLQCRCARLKCK